MFLALSSAAGRPQADGSSCCGTGPRSDSDRQRVLTLGDRTDQAAGRSWSLSGRGRAGFRPVAHAADLFCRAVESLLDLERTSPTASVLSVRYEIQRSGEVHAGAGFTATTIKGATHHTVPTEHADVIARLLTTVVIEGCRVHTPQIRVCRPS